MWGRAPQQRPPALPLGHLIFVRAPQRRAPARPRGSGAGRRAPASAEPGCGAEPLSSVPLPSHSAISSSFAPPSGAHLRAREAAARGGGPPRAPSRGVGQSPSAASPCPPTRPSHLRSRPPAARTCAPARQRRGAAGPRERRAGVWGRAPQQRPPALPLGHLIFVRAPQRRAPARLRGSGAGRRAPASAEPGCGAEPHLIKDPPQRDDKPNSVPDPAPEDAGQATTIPLAPPSLVGSSDLPGGFGRAVLIAPPYLVLLRAGFSLPSALRRTRCALTAPFHPYPPPPCGRRRAVCFLCHFPSGHPDRGLPGALPSGVRTFLPARCHVVTPRAAVVCPSATDCQRASISWGSAPDPGSALVGPRRPTPLPRGRAPARRLPVSWGSAPDPGSALVGPRRPTPLPRGRAPARRYDPVHPLYQLAKPFRLRHGVGGTGWSLLPPAACLLRALSSPVALLLDLILLELLVQIAARRIDHLGGLRDVPAVFPEPLHEERPLGDLLELS